MKKCLMFFVFYLSSLIFAETWEFSLQSCDNSNGFWFPSKEWTDKGEPWIKPFANGKFLHDYQDVGIQFYYNLPVGPIPCYGNACLGIINGFMIDQRYKLSMTNHPVLEDSIYFLTICLDSLMYKYKNGTLSSKDFSLAEKKDFEYWRNHTDDSSYFNFSFIWETPSDLECTWQSDLEWGSKKHYYFIYKKSEKGFEYNALCHLFYAPFVADSSNYKIQCEFQDDGSLNFTKVPNVNDIPKDSCLLQKNTTALLRRVNSFLWPSKHQYYRVNGTLSSKSSCILINGNKPTLQLKGKH